MCYYITYFIVAILYLVEYKTNNCRLIITKILPCFTLIQELRQESIVHPRFIKDLTEN